MGISLLLVGRDGNGKSSTGNSILGSKYFTPTSNFSSDGVDIEKFSEPERKVSVTEIAGLEYPGLGPSESFEKTFTKIESIFGDNPTGFNAVVIVLKYGVRFTKQEKDALLLIKSIFGSNVVKNFGVIVMTCGDIFNLDVEEDEQTFEEWCQEQTGDVRTLFDDCENRCVLFNNREKDPQKLEAQWEKLLSKISSITQLYTLDEYNKAAKGRTGILVQSKLPEYEKHKIQVMSEVWNQLNTSCQEYSKEPRHIWNLVTLLDSLQQKVSCLKKKLLDEDRNTGILKHLLSDISVAEMRISTQLNMAELRLPVSASATKWLIFSVEKSGSDLQGDPETVSIRECSIDEAGNITSSSASDVDVSGCGNFLVEVGKTTSKLQQKAKTLGSPDGCSGSEMATEDIDQWVHVNKDQCQEPHQEKELVRNLEPRTDMELVATVKDMKPPTDRELVATDQDIKPPTDRELVATVKDMKPPTDRELVPTDQDIKPPTDRELLATVKDMKPPTDRELVATDKDPEPNTKMEELAMVEDREPYTEIKQVGVVEDHEPPTDMKPVTTVEDPETARDMKQAAKIQDHELSKDTEKGVQFHSHDPQQKDVSNVNKVCDQDKHNDLENRKIMFQTFDYILKQYNCNNIIGLLLKYEQTWTKQEIDIVMKRIEAILIKNASHQRILILICDHDNLETEKNQMFEDWLKREGDANQLWQLACKERSVLLNPWVEDKNILLAQKLRLLSLIGKCTESTKENAMAQKPEESVSTRPKKDLEWYFTKASNWFSSLWNNDHR